MKANKEKIIDEIVLAIEAGNNYNSVASQICTKFQFTERTFANYWNAANESYKVILENRRGIFENKTAEAFLQEIETVIMNRSHKLKILEKIAKGEITFKKYFSVNGKIESVDIVPDASERIKAIEIHNKMQGDNAPEIVNSIIKAESSVLDWILSKKPNEGEKTTNIY